MRTLFDQYVNMRPSKAWHPYTPLKDEKDFDILFLRENTEDFYMGAGGKTQSGGNVSMKLKRELYEAQLNLQIDATPANEFAFEIGMMSRQGIERFADYCCRTAKDLGKTKVTAVLSTCMLMRWQWHSSALLKNSELLLVPICSVISLLTSVPKLWAA